MSHATSFLAYSVMLRRNNLHRYDANFVKTYVVSLKGLEPDATLALSIAEFRNPNYTAVGIEILDHTEALAHVHSH